MSDSKLSDVLAVKDGEIVQRAAVEPFGDFIARHWTPEMTYADYVALCKKCRRIPNDQEWQSIHFNNEPTPDGAA